MYDDTQRNRESVRTNTGYAYESFSKVYWDRVYFLQNRESVRTNTGKAYERFSKVYWDRVYFFARRVVCDRVRLSTPSGTPPPVQMKVESPPPPRIWGLSVHGDVAQHCLFQAPKGPTMDMQEKLIVLEGF